MRPVLLNCMNKFIRAIGLAAILSVSSITTLPAYALKYDLSQGFKEPTDGSLKVMLLKNGNTALLRIKSTEGISITLFDTNRKKISKIKHDSNLWGTTKTNSPEIKRIYEIDGNMVIFIQQTLDRTPVLFRLVIDGQTGTRLKEEKIGSLHRYGSKDFYAMKFGDVLPDDFYIEKDEYSDNYAVVHFMGFEPDRNKRIQVVHYNKEHQEISRAYFNSPDNQFKYLNYVGMIVLGNKSVLVTVYGYNTDNSGGKDSRLIVSKLEKGSPSFKHKLLEFTDDFKDTKAILRYNPQTDVLAMLSITMVSTQKKFLQAVGTATYMPLLTFIDPNSFSLLKVIPLQLPKLDELAQKNGSPNGFAGLPQDFYINANNTYTVVSEEITKKLVRHQSRIVTYLGNIGVSTIDANGDETASNLIPMSQTGKGGLYNPMYLNERRNTVQELYFGAQFLSFSYNKSQTAGYIFFNDNAKNTESIRNGKIATVNAISGTDAFYHVLKNGDFQREYVFGNPEGKNDKRFAMFSVSDYNPDTHTYVTIMIDKEDNKKVAKVAWVYLD